MICPTCHRDDGYPGEPPPEPAVGAWVKDRHGQATMHQVQTATGGWGEPGMMPLASWDAMWRHRGPLVPCGPWGAEEAEED